MQSKNPLPPPEEHLLHLSSAQAWLLSKRKRSTEDVRLLSVSLSAIYEAATCHRACHGGEHVLEAIFGRSYNFAQYDEALNLIRGLGEINNLLLLFVHEPELISAWLKAPKKERLNKFGPAQVRKKLAKHVSWEPAGDDWYSELCEEFVHVQPATRPGMPSHGVSGRIGPIPQKEGEERAIGELHTVVFSIALAACRWFKFDDTRAELGLLVESLKLPPANDG